MNQWPTKKLTDVCDLMRGTEPGSAFYIGASDKTIPFLRVGDLTGKVDAPKFVKNDNSKLQIVNENETLITLDGTPGIVVRGFKGAIASGIRVIRNFKPEVNESFLFYYLKTSNVQKTIKAYSKGATIIHASAAIPHIKIPLPPLKSQQKIVERLDAIKKAQKLNDELIQKADELFQSLLHKEFNLAGKDWEIKKLKDLIENIKIGPFGSALKIAELSENGPVRVLFIENVVNNEFNWSKEKYISEEKYKELTAYTVKREDIIVTMMGTIGRTCIAPKNIGRAIISSHLIKITPNQKVIIPEFLNFSLRGNSFVTRQIWHKAKGAIMKGLNSTILKNLDIPAPSLKIQKQIVAKLSAAQEYKKQLLAQKSKLKELFDSVLNKLMTPAPERSSVRGKREN